MDTSPAPESASSISCACSSASGTPPNSTIMAPPNPTPAAAAAPTPAVAVSAALPPQPIPSTASVPPNVVTIPVPIVQNEETYAYITVKASLHDRSCSVFGLNDAEVLAVSKRFDSVKPVVNGVMVSTQPMIMLNTLAQLSYKVVASCGEAEICWTMQREI